MNTLNIFRIWNSISSRITYRIEDRFSKVLDCSAANLYPSIWNGVCVPLQGVVRNVEYLDGAC